MSTSKAKKKSLVFFGLALSLSYSAFASDVVCDTTLYYCGAGDGDNVTVNTTDDGGTAPLSGYAVYLNSSKYNLNNVTITTQGSKADGIMSNGNNGSVFVAQGKVDILATGNGADGINLGARGGPNTSSSSSPSFNTAILSGNGGKIVADGIAVRANNNLTEGSKTIIILGNDYTITQTGQTVDNSYEGSGYAVYAGNRDEDISGFGGWDWLFRGYRNNNKGNSFVFIGDNATITSSSVNQGAAVYANKSGVIQLGNGVKISAPDSSYHLYASTEKQKLGPNNATEIAEERPGTILLVGDTTLNENGSENSLIVLAKGKDSIIKSGYLDLSYDTSSTVPNVVIGDQVNDASGIFNITGKVSAIEGGLSS